MSRLDREADEFGPAAAEEEQKREQYLQCDHESRALELVVAKNAFVKESDADRDGGIQDSGAQWAAEPARRSDRAHRHQGRLGCRVSFESPSNAARAKTSS